MHIPRPGQAARCVALAVLLCAGCSRSATVSGKVTYKSEPVKRGEISFVAADGRSVSTPIDDDGNYVVANVPTGEVRVLVRAVKGEGDAAFGFAVLPKPPVVKSTIPERFSQLESSDLKYTIASGSQKLDIDLPD